MSRPPYSYRDNPEWVPSEARKLTGVPVHCADGMSWEMDEGGWHRIVEHDGVGGPWAPYNSIARSPSGGHIALTQYWDGDLPTECVVAISPLSIHAPHDPVERGDRRAGGTGIPGHPV